MRDLNKKIAIKQRIIDRQNETIRTLQEENENLKLELELEMVQQKEGYDKAKELIISMQKHIEEYEKAITDLRKSKAYYDKASKELLELKGKYIREMERFMNSLPNHDRI